MARSDTDAQAQRAILDLSYESLSRARELKEQEPELYNTVVRMTAAAQADRISAWTQASLEVSNRCIQ